MRKYWSFFSIRFSTGLQYRAAAVAGIVTQFAWGAMELLMFAAFYRAGGGEDAMTFPQLASYIWLQQAFLALFMTWFFENEIFEAIAGGGVAYELCRPMDLYAQWFTRSVANRLSRAVLRCMPILIVAVLLPEPWRLGPPAGAGALGLFAISTALGLGVVVAFCMLVYISMFYTLSPVGIRIVLVSMVEFFSGAVVPLPLLPDRVHAVFNWLPFASMQNVPLRIYSGNLAGTEALMAMALQLAWLAALVLLGKLMMRRALRRVVVQGG